MLNKFIRRCLRAMLSGTSWDLGSGRYWSQEGEDIVLSRALEGRSIGFYVDVGAHHPTRFSNTYHFYRRGWRGINIDATPGSMREFRKLRPRDINIECGVGLSSVPLNFYIFDEPALNSFSHELSAARNTIDSRYKIIETTTVEVRPLREILQEYLPKGQRIDFLSIDVEGFDLSVIESNDWSAFRPSFVLVEIIGSSLAKIQNDPVAKYMASVNYEVFSKCAHTVIFKDMRFDC